MLFQNPFVLGLVATVGFFIAAVNITSVVRRLRARRRANHVALVATRRSLTQLDKAIPDHVSSRARQYRGREHPADVSDLVLGKDTEGAFYVGRRVVDLHEHHMMLFDVSAGSNLEGFRIEPRNVAPAARGLRGLWDRLRGSGYEQWRLQMVWDVSLEKEEDDATVSLGTEILRHVRGIARSPRGMMLGVGVRDRQIVIQSIERYDYADFDRFLDSAVSLRLDIITSLRQTGNTRAVKVSDQILTTNNSDRVVDARLAPMSPLQESMQEDSLGWAVRNGKKVFEIPEPEEDVVVLGIVGR